MASKTFHGGRAIAYWYDPLTGKAEPIGIFNTISYGVTYDVSPVSILGKLGPAELVYTAMEAVSISASGWRVFDHGPHVSAKVPRL